MKNVTEQLDNLISKGWEGISECDDTQFAFKPSEDRWSKKEILGHLIDSAINNLKRFTEVQFESKPYKITPYNQDGLVLVNDYQNANREELLLLWKVLNVRIKNIFKSLPEESLSYKVILPDDTESDLQYVMISYVDHLSHHIDQIVSNK